MAEVTAVSGSIFMIKPHERLWVWVSWITRLSRPNRPDMLRTSSVDLRIARLNRVMLLPLFAVAAAFALELRVLVFRAREWACDAEAEALAADALSVCASVFSLSDRFW